MSDDGRPEGCALWTINTLARAAILYTPTTLCVSLTTRSTAFRMF